MAPDEKAVQTSNVGPTRQDTQGRPAQATLDTKGRVAVVADPQGHAPPPAAPNAPAGPDIQVPLPPDQPHPVGPAPTGGPAEPPRAHGQVPTPEEAKTSPAAVSPVAAPAQQAIPGQQHATAQQSPPQAPQSRFAASTPAQPPENAPRPADAPERSAQKGKSQG